MHTRVFARWARLRAGALAACLIAIGAATATATPAGAESAGEVTMAGAGGQKTVRYGQRVRLSGTVAQAEPGRPVRLEWAARGEGWRPVAETRSGQGGAWRFQVRARRSGAYRAVSDTGGASAARRVRVFARLSGRARRHLRRGSAVRVRGLVRPGVSGRSVSLQLRTARGWRTVDRTRTGGGGRFRAVWRPDRPGSFRLRVRFRGDRLNVATSRKLRGRVRVYRPGHASWYGPGFYGRRTACGQTIGYGTLGVANKHLPCGTRVTFRYGGRSVTVRVIDRGPYAAGREWDLTAATKRRLGFPSTGVVWSTR